MRLCRYIADTKFDHDVAGWEAGKFAAQSMDMNLTRPDWVCEVVSSPYKGEGKKADEERDTVHKLQLLPRFNVPHYWLFFTVSRKAGAAVNGP